MSYLLFFIKIQYWGLYSLSTHDFLFFDVLLMISRYNYLLLQVVRERFFHQKTNHHQGQIHVTCPESNS